MSIKKRSKALLGVAVLSAGILAGCSTDKGSQVKEEVINVYSARHYDADKEMYEEFQKDTGIKVNVIEGKAPELLERLKREGADTQADVFVTSDIANLYQAVEAGLTQNVESEIVNKNIPENLRGENNEWVGLTQRARIIAYDKAKVNPEELSTYEELTSDKWDKKVLVRSSESTYNQSLLASFIDLNGEKSATDWAQGIVNNFARQPQGNDRDQVKAIAAGEGEVAIVNSYYIGKMVNSEDAEEKKAVEKVGVFFPENTHINVSGIVLGKYSKNKENAVKFIEYMTEEKAQKAFTDINSEYPANPNVEPSELLKSWGEFTTQDINLTNVGKYNKQAVEIFNKVGWK